MVFKYLFIYLLNLARKCHALQNLIFIKVHSKGNKTKPIQGNNPYVFSEISYIQKGQSLKHFYNTSLTCFSLRFSTGATARRPFLGSADEDIFLDLGFSDILTTSLNVH